MERKLNIGCRGTVEGWETFDIREPATHVGDCSDMSRFHSGEFDVVYASHVLEHVSFEKTLATVRGWVRILRPGGKLFLAVPDVAMCGQVLLDPETSVEIKMKIMRVIYGGQTGPHDFHMSGFTPDMMGPLMQHAGVSSAKQVRAFGIFNDCSEVAVNGQPLSINVIATK